VDAGFSIVRWSGVVARDEVNADPNTLAVVVAQENDALTPASAVAHHWCIQVLPGTAIDADLDDALGLRAQRVPVGEAEARVLITVDEKLRTDQASVLIDVGIATKIGTEDLRSAQGLGTIRELGHTLGPDATFDAPIPERAFQIVGPDDGLVPDALLDDLIAIGRSVSWCPLVIDTAIVVSRDFRRWGVRGRIAVRLTTGVALGVRTVSARVG